MTTSLSPEKTDTLRCLNNVPRILTPSPEEFWNEYVLPRRPVILTDFLEAEGIRQADTKDKAMACIGEVPLDICREYVNEILDCEPGARLTLSGGEIAKLTLRQYFDIVDRDRNTDLKCTEQVVPEGLRALYRVPELCRYHRTGDPEELLSHVFTANAGNVATTHFDGDYRNVLLYQIFGAKRVCILPAQAAEILEPTANFSSVLLQKYPASEKSELIEDLGGWDTVLLPSETIFMPALVFHYVEYLEDGMSINFRFGRNLYHRFFDRYLPLNRHSQNIAVAMLTESSVEGEFRPHFSKIVHSALNGEDLAPVLEEIYETLRPSVPRLRRPIPNEYRLRFPEGFAGKGAPEARLTAATLPPFLRPFLSSYPL